MQKTTVTIGEDYYEITALTCDKSGAITIDLIAEFSPLLVSLFDGNTELLNEEIRKSANSEKLMRICSELINPMLLRKNGDIVSDWRIEFSCKPLTFFKLGYEALRLNCEDFFTFISGFAKEKLSGIDLKETINNLKKDGVEIPPMFSLLMQNGEEKTDIQPKQV